MRQDRHSNNANKLLLATLCALVLTACGGGGGGGGGSANQIDITRVSVASDGTQGNADSYNLRFSSDGRYMAFTSEASNLVADDTNNGADVFLRDADSGITTRVSVATDGSQGNASSLAPAISADGRYVVFQSYASNLVTDDSNAEVDVFLYDSTGASIQRVSLASDGVQGNGSSTGADISANGRYIAFTSTATNLVADDTNGATDIFLRDSTDGSTRRVSLASDGSQANASSFLNAMSADGRYISFASDATNLVAGDTNALRDIFVHDTSSGTTTLVSVASDGTQSNGSSRDSVISADGRYISFESSATTLVADDTNGTFDIFLHDNTDGSTIRVSLASDGSESNERSYDPAISADGRYIVFESVADNLVADDSNASADVLLRDTSTGTTRLVSLARDGSQGNGNSLNATISADGRYVAFHSEADNLVAGDSNTVTDVFRVLWR